jgi:hypothetical protein
VHDAALELMPAVGVHRAQDEATWREVGVVLAHVHLAVEARHKALNAHVDENPKRSVEYTFLTWSRRNHAFDSVRGRAVARWHAVPPWAPPRARRAARSREHACSLARALSLSRARAFRAHCPRLAVSDPLRLRAPLLCCR